MWMTHQADNGRFAWASAPKKWGGHLGHEWVTTRGLRVLSPGANGQFQWAESQDQSAGMLSGLSGWQDFNHGVRLLDKPKYVCIYCIYIYIYMYIIHFALGPSNFPRGKWRAHDVSSEAKHALLREFRGGPEVKKNTSGGFQKWENPISGIVYNGKSS